MLKVFREDMLAELRCVTNRERVMGASPTDKLGVCFAVEHVVKFFDESWYFGYFVFGLPVHECIL